MEKFYNNVLGGNGKGGQKAVRTGEGLNVLIPALQYNYFGAPASESAYPRRSHS